MAAPASPPQHYAIVAPLVWDLLLSPSLALVLTRSSFMRLPDNSPGGSESSGGFGSARMNPNAEPDFSEFMWMAEEDLEAFDHKVICEVNQVMMEQSSTLREDEEEFLRRMLEEEEQRETVYYHQYQEEKMRNDATSNLTSSLQKMGVNENVAAKSTLNPYAAEFIPGKNLTRPAGTQSLVHHTNGEKKSS